MVCNKEKEIMMINNQGIVIRLEISGISVMGRSTHGVRLLKLDKTVQIVTIAEVINEEEIDDLNL
jgi:DNA gyrase subunit A